MEVNKNNPCSGVYGKSLDIKMTDDCNGQCDFFMEKQQFDEKKIDIDRKIISTPTFYLPCSDGDDKVSYYEIYHLYKLAEQDGYEIKSIWYRYVHSCYEGNGSALILTNKGWLYWDLGHCSCYGPFDNFETGMFYETIWQLLRNHTGGVANDLKEIIDFLLETGVITSPI